MQILRKAHGHAKSHYHKHYRARYEERAHLVFLLDAILVLTALGLLGLALFFRFAYHPLRDDFKLSLLTEQSITAGKETIFTVRIVNGGETRLHGARLAVHLPETFVPAEMPAGYEEETGEIAIGEMASDISNEYRFRGTLLGPEGSADLYVHFTAQNDEGRSDETLTKGTLGWKANAVDMRFETPDSVVPGQSVAMALRVKNGSGLAFDKAAIVPDWPAGFVLRNATPPLYRGRIALGRLEAGEEIVVNFSGRFDGLVDLVAFGARLEGEVRERTLAIAAARKDVRMADVGLRLHASFPEGAPAFAHPGEEVPVVVSYLNEGARPIKNLALEIAPDVNTLGTVRWETSNRIASLAAGERGERKAFVRVRDAVSRYVTDPVFRAVPRATFSIDDPKITDANVNGAAVETKIAGSAKLRAVARYYTNEGDQLGRGPLPPRVDRQTRYWIFASLETGATEVQDGVVTFRLPNRVTWTGRGAVTVGQDLALEGDRLVWRIGSTEPHAGLLHEAPGASFEVVLTPAADQVGTSPLLLAGAAFTGQDAWTSEFLSSSQPGLTTQLPGDSAVGSRTRVTE